jgi:hypothetical protein
MQLAVPFYLLRSVLDGKEPILTSEKVAEMTLPKRVSAKKAMAELDYRITPLETSISDSYEWLKQEGLLKR